MNQHLKGGRQELQLCPSASVSGDKDDVIDDEKSFDFCIQGRCSILQMALFSSEFAVQCLLVLVMLKQQVERLMILLSLVEKLRPYHGHEETPEMMAARIDRDVVSTFICRSLALFFLKRKKY